MNPSTSFRTLFLLLTAIILVSPCVGQQRRGAPTPRKPPAAAPEPIPTFDTLLADDTYKMYSEMRNVGTLLRSPALNDLLEPLFRVSSTPKEFKALLKWMKAHGDALASSRMFAASWSIKPSLPSVLLAVEFASADEAKKFEAELRGFVPKLLAKPSPSHSPSTPVSPSVSTGPPKIAATPVQVEEPAAPSYQIKQVGSLVLLSDKVVSLKELKPKGSRLLAENPTFALARNRFASESLFLFVDLKSIEKEQEEQARKYEEEEQKRKEIEAANPPIDEEIADSEEPMLVPPDDNEIPYGPPASSDPSPDAELTSPTPEPEKGTNNAKLSATGPNEPDMAMVSLYAAFFGGRSKWPEAVAAAAVFEDEGYSLRVLIANGEGNKARPIPFVPQLISGPAITPAAAGVMPADTSYFVSLSLDYQQIYDGMVKAMTYSEERGSRVNTSRPVIVNDQPPSSPFAYYEKKLGLKVKDDVLPLLGNEIALAMPAQSLARPTTEPGKEKTANEATPSKPGEPSFTPIFAVAVKDRDGVKRLIPKIIESMSFKGADMLAQTEKHDDAEITTYANLLSYAFLGDFLVVSPDPSLTRRVVDSYLSHQTLASDSHFKNSIRWQPRQLQGQMYAASSIVDLYYPLGKDQPAEENNQLRELLSGMGPVIDPLTYALSDDGAGPLHELRVPKNLLLMVIAGMSSEASKSSLMTNESIARSLLRTIVSAEATFKTTKGDGRYGTLDELITEGLISKDLIEKYGYRLELSILSNKFEATAIPLEYGKTGKMSFFVDESGVLRGGDHGGGAATLSDKPVEQ